MKYSVIVDAGSSGSRAFVYTWPDAESYLDGLSQDSILRQALLPIETTPLWVNKVKPGISSYKGKIAHIWKDHLNPLLKKTKEIVPKDQHHETPFYFLATAGLRLLPEQDRQEILAEVCRLLQKKTDFLVPECESHVAMIDGQTEGIYGWLGLNYLIHWSLSKNWHDFSNTYGFLDMGGASAQLAFASSAESEHKDDLHTVRIRTASGKSIEWHVFVTTWLGFGANQARARFREQLLSELSPEEVAEYEGQNAAIPILDPCLPQGAAELVDVSTGKHCIFQGSGHWEECEKRVARLLNEEIPCKDEPCLFDGVHVPDFNLSNGKFVGVSEYWYTLQDIFKHNGKFNYETLESNISDLCRSDWAALRDKIASGDFTRSDGSKMTDEDIQQSCFKSAWVLTILSKGFNFPLNPKNPALDHKFQDTFQSAMEIEGTEISWTLGRAVLYASSEIPADNANDAKPVGITTSDGNFFTGGGVPTVDGHALSSQNNGHFTARSTWIWMLLLIAILGLVLKFTSVGTKMSKTRLGKKFRRFVRTWIPCIEQQFQQRTASNIGYGNSYPHAGIPLSNLDIYSSEGISTSRPPVRTPSRVGSYISLTGHED